MKKRDRQKLKADLFKQLATKKDEILAALDSGENVQLVLDFGQFGRKYVGTFGLDYKN